MRCIRCRDIQWVSDDIDDRPYDGKIHGRFARIRAIQGVRFYDLTARGSQGQILLHHGDVSDDVVQVQKTRILSGHAGKMSLVRIDRRNILREMIKINFGRT